MKIIDLDPNNEAILHQMAAMLVEAFQEHWPLAWPTLDDALEEVQEALQADNINRVAVDEEGRVLGWIGGINQYDGHAWELHPLVVRPDQQGQGIGQALVADFEERVCERGGLTVYLGSDDEDNMTSLAAIELYPNVLDHLARIKNLRCHPFEFYQKQGYTIVGVIPDANGWGKPDIMLAKRVGEK